MKSKTPLRAAILAGACAIAAIAPLAWVTAAGAQQAPAAAGATSTPPEFTIDVSGWTGGAQGDRDTGRFSHCGVSREYNNGLTLVFLLSSRYELNIGMVNPAWDLLAAAAAEAEAEAEADDDEDEPPLAQVAVDGLYAKELPVRPISETVLMVNTGADQQLFELLQRGNVLTVTAEQGSYRFPLTGTSNALDSLRGCIDAARRIVAAQAQAASALSAQGLATILRDSGLQDAAIVTPPVGEPQAVAHRFGWTVGPLEGGLHQAPRGQTVEIDRYADIYMDQFEAACDAPFQRLVEPATLVRDVFALKSATVQCGGGDGTFTALFFSLDGTHYTAFYHRAPVADRDLAIDATDRIRQYITQQSGGG
ncbi:MAG: hypothetical protein HKM95_18265 [Inquilinus sp.]|nr:hypothetical protein [Inquilinus sp.]